MQKALSVAIALLALVVSPAPAFAKWTRFTSEHFTFVGDAPERDMRLIAQQLESGAFKYLPSESSANQYSSQDAVRALAGGGFTAEPPKPSSGEKWFAATEWGTGATETAPLAQGSVDAVAVDGMASEAMLASLVRALKGKGRMLGPASLSLPEGLVEIARDDEVWVARLDVKVTVSAPVQLKRRDG